MKSYNSEKNLVFVINVDWYFKLHWLDRAKYFRDKGFNVHIITNFTREDILNDLISKGYTCHPVNIERKSVNFLQELSSILRIRDLISKINPDLIHCVTVKPNIYGGVLNRLFFGKPIVYSVTGLGAIYTSKRPKFILLKKIVTTLFKITSTKKSRFIFENSEDFQRFSSLGILKFCNGSVIRGAGIDLSRFSQSKPNNSPTVNVLFAARLLEDKGLHCLVEAKKILIKQGVTFELQVAGILDNDVSGAISLKQIEMWASEGLINWLGNVQDMPNLIKTNDIVCLPTTYGEGVPRILIEAASCQRAIVTTDVAGCREIVDNGRNGILVQPSDANALANGLNELIADREKIIQFGINGRAKVEKEYSQELVFSKTHAIYDQLLAD